MNLEVLLLGAIISIFLILFIEIGKLLYIWFKERIRYRRNLEKMIIEIYDSQLKKRSGKK